MSLIIRKTLAELATKVGGILKGDADCIIESIGALQSAEPGQISFLNSAKYRRYLSETQASAVILRKSDLDFCRTNALIVKDPYYAYAKIAEIFVEYPKVVPGIHTTAVIGKNCHIDKTASIGPHVVIEDEVTIGANTQIDPGCVIGERCRIGNDCHLWANVTLYYNVQLGNRVVIHSGTIVGSDGFGWAPHQGEWYKVPQLGSVIIGDDVDIGANTAIDRGALDDTIIGKGVILDNLIQIAHNVQIGDYTAIAGCTAIAGSTKIGKHCMIGGGSAINGHIEIADYVILTGTTAINQSIKESGMYSSGTPSMKTEEWRRIVVRFRQLDKMAKRIQALEDDSQHKKSKGGDLA